MERKRPVYDEDQITIFTYAQLKMRDHEARPSLNENILLGYKLIQFKDKIL